MRVYDAGSDWLTLTVLKEHKQRDAIGRVVQQAQSDLHKGGYELKPQKWLGYEGAAVCGLFVGVRNDSMIIRASGNESKLIEKIFRDKNWKVRCTRCDLQITCQTGPQETNYGRRVQLAFKKAQKSDGRTARLNSASYKAAGVDIGLTIGARSSGSYSRFYNKTVEQRGRVAQGLWRYEVEFKGKQAQYIWDMLQSASRGYWLALSVVKEQFSRNGFDMGWVTTSEQVELPTTYTRNDNERRLLWLDTHVKRTVHKLIKEVGRDAVYNALDLQ